MSQLALSWVKTRVELRRCLASGEAELADASTLNRFLLGDLLVYSVCCHERVAGSARCLRAALSTVHELFSAKRFILQD